MENKITQKRSYIDEIFILRSIACLSIVLLHSIAFAQLNHLDINNTNMQDIISSFRVLLTFGTPTFVFISELLISYSYPDKLPKGFLLKRIKLIIIPYLSMAIFYALISPTPNAIKIIMNMLGGYHGYFVLIIFQFYVLHLLFHKYLSKQKPLKVIFLSLIINIVYLAVFNFFKVPIQNNLLEYFWDRGHWLVFIAWIFYFSLAYYCGRFYKEFLVALKKYKSAIFSSIFITGAAVVVLSYLNILPYTSKTVAMVFFTANAIAVIYYHATKIKKVPSVLMLVSRYSFSIYLLHIFFLDIINYFAEAVGINLGAFSVIYLFLGSIVCSIFTTYLLNKISIGKYVVGKVGVGKKLKLSKKEIAA